MKNSKNFVKGIFIGMTIMCLTAFAAEKVFTLKFSEGEINKHYQKLTLIRQIIDNSNLAHQDVVFVTKSIDSLQSDIFSQVKVQLDQAPSPKK